MTRRSTSFLFSVGLLLIAPLDRAHSQNMVGVSWTGAVYNFESSTGVGSVVGNIGLGVGANSMATDSAGHVIVGHRMNPSPPHTWDLLAIDPSNGGVLNTLAQSSFDLRGLAFDPNDNLYAIVDGSSTSSGFDELFSIDLGTQTFTSLGSTGLVSIQAFAIAANGTMYGWDVNSGGLHTINPLTGVATDVNPAIGPIGSGGEVQFLAARSDGMLIGGRTSLYLINPTTGAFTTISGPVFSDLRGADFIPSCAFPYGTGCAGSGGFTPSVSVSGCPAAGASFQLQLMQGLGGATAVFGLGLNQGQASLGGGCFLNVTPLLPALINVPLGGVGPGAGATSLNAPVPPGTSGLKFTLQAFVIDPGVANGFSATRGFEINIQ